MAAVSASARASSTPLALHRLGVDQRDAKALRGKLGEREREAAPGKAAAGNRDVETIPASCAGIDHCPAMPRSAPSVNLLKARLGSGKGHA